MTAGQVNDYIGAVALLDDLPKAKWLLCDRGYDADWFRDALQAKGHPTLHPRSAVPQRNGQVRRAPIQASQSHRDHVRTPEGLAPRRHPLRPMPYGLLLRRRPRRTVIFWL